MDVGNSLGADDWDIQDMKLCLAIQYAHVLCPQDK
jgi:hypothetical protein